jgi:nickel-type superoxide dismutase maturation protease
MFGLKILKVKGQSMAPAIPPDCFILASKWLMLFPVRAGQRLVISHSTYGVIVKTVAMVDKNGFIWSRGENNGSLSVEQLGPVDKQQIIGRVVCVFRRDNDKL